MATTPQTATQPSRRDPATCRPRRAGTCGCTSRAWARTTRSTRSRSSSGATAATSGTSTATATSTASRRCSASTPATAAPSSARRPSARSSELGFYTNWSYAHPPAIELADKIASLAPGDLNRVFFTSGGSEAVESAWKLARAYHKLNGEAQRTKIDRARDRLPRHHPRRALGHRHHLAAHAVRAARAGRLPRAEHQLLPLARGPRPALGGRADRGTGSSSRARRPSPP